MQEDSGGEVATGAGFSKPRPGRSEQLPDAEGVQSTEELQMMGPEWDAQQVADQLQKVRDYRPSGLLVSVVILTVGLATAGACFIIAWMVN